MDLVQLTGGIATAACLAAIAYYIYDNRARARAPAAPRGPSAREINPRRITTAEVQQVFKPTGKQGELLFAKSEDGSKQVTAQWQEYSGDGLIHLLVGFVYNKYPLRLNEEIVDQTWTHKASNLQQVCATEMVREVQRGGPYVLRLLRDEYIAERKQAEVRKGEVVDSCQVRFYLDGRRATYLRSSLVR